MSVSEEAQHPLVMLEENYAMNGYKGAQAEDILYVPGTLPLLISAPHAVWHHRLGSPKLPDRGTGAFAEALSRQIGAHLLVARGEQTLDGAWYEESLFQSRLREILPKVDFVLDVHGMRDSHGVDICLGSGPFPELSELLRESVICASAKMGLSVGVDYPFPAIRAGCITRFVQESGKGALQLEIAAAYRIPEADLTRVSTLLSLLATQLSERLTSR